jgi:AAA+ superfamily predicted ATPase
MTTKATITTTTATTANGNGFAFSTASTTVTAGDWRGEAVGRMLDNAADDGTPVFLLLDAARRHAPERAVRTFSEDRAAALRAFGVLLSGFGSILASPAHYHADEDGENVPPTPIYGWWAGTDPEDGAEFDIALEPGFYSGARFIVLGPSEERCHRLIERVQEEARGFRCRCRRFAGNWEDDPAMQGEVAKISWDDIVLAPETIADIRHTIAQFFERREVFARLRFPWRRGVLLVGPPGTGKTMVCKAAAASYPELPFLYVGDIGRRSVTAEIEQVFKHARQSAPCILAFEDLDGLVDRANRTVFLNELDGFRDNDGLLIIASSNHPERIDEAILKRPSRFDRVYHIGLPARPERVAYCKMLLARSPAPLAPSLDVDALAEKVADSTEGFTPAFLKEAYLSAVLQLAHEGLEEMDESFGAALLEQADFLRRYLKKAKNPEAMADMLASSGSGENIGFRNR